jgi:hypothetical protein
MIKNIKICDFCGKEVAINDNCGPYVDGWSVEFSYDFCGKCSKKIKAEVKKIISKR